MSAPSRRALLSDMPAVDADRAVGPDSIVVLPVGAIEQHGPHLPLSTDSLIACAAADEFRANPPDGVDVHVLPTLVYSCSSEHLFAPGTMSLSESTFLAVVNDIGASVAALGARRFVIVNGHGGNTALLRVVCRQLRISHGLLTFLMHPMLSADHGGNSAGSAEHGLGCHANQSETAIMLHLHPDLVRMDRAQRNLPEWLGEYDHIGLGGNVAFGWSADDFGPSGVIGDPTSADAALGRELWEHAVAQMRAALGEIARFDFPSGDPSGDGDGPSA